MSRLYGDGAPPVTTALNPVRLYSCDALNAALAEDMTWADRKEDGHAHAEACALYLRRELRTVVISRTGSRCPGKVAAELSGSDICENEKARV
jgi:hypothetical protein